MRMFLKSAMVAMVVLAGGVLSPAGPLDAFPSFSLTPGSPSAGVLTPGGVLNPATGAPTPGGPQPPPVVAITAAALGVPAGGNVDDISYGDDELLYFAFGLAGGLNLQFSVDNAATGGFWLPPVPAQNVLTQGVVGEGAAGTDIFTTAALVLPPPFGPLACGPGGNMQVYDGNGLNVFPPVLVPGIGGLIDPPLIGPFDDVDAYEQLGPGAVDYQTFLSPPLSGADGRPDGPVFFTVDPATAALMGVTAADVLVTDPGSPTGWSIYAPALALGLIPGDNIDALLVADSASAAAGPGGAIPPARTFADPADFVGFSLAPGSLSLGFPLAIIPAVCAPGIKTPGDVWGVSPFFGGVPFAVFAAENLGLCSVRVCAMNDNLDAMDISWPGDADADGAPDALEPGCGAAVGPADTDADGLPDSIEMVLSTSPAGVCTGFVPFAPPPGAPGLPDSDFDGLIDSWEIAYWTSTCPAANPSLPDAGADTDGDGATNIVEQGQGTSPCLTDTDADGFGDLAATLHSGPANLLPGVDNCPAVVNPTQMNSDGNYTDLSPGRTYDDLTWPSSDAMGDACDTDDDNDYIADATETGGPPCASATGATLPASRDTDGDRMLDGAECAFGTNPNVVNAAPAGCSTPGDLDLDGVNDAREFCYYGTSTGSTNSDGDACTDGREVASINADLTVNAIDLSQVASAFGLYVVPNVPHLLNFDVTKDGNINAVDLSQVAQRFGACP